MDALQILCLNCHTGINNKRKLDQIIYYLSTHKWQIALLQETSKLHKETLERMTYGLGSFVIQNPNTPKRPGGGVAVLIKDGIKNQIKEYGFFAEERGIRVSIEIRGSEYTVCNFYRNFRRRGAGFEPP